MVDLIDRWGERTILRAETGDDLDGMELILRLKGELKKIEREEIVLFIEKVIRMIYGDRQETISGYRAVSFGGSKTAVKRISLSKTHKILIENVINGLKDRLNQKGNKELHDFLSGLIRKF
ncbi:hypothetical protein ACFL7D_04135 [candidate division KSB1 bacterium]